LTLGPVLPLAIFMLSVLALATFALAASGHFPATGRLPDFTSPSGHLILWGSIAIAILAAVLTVVFAARRLAWPPAIIGGGTMVLVAPLVLNLFPDRVVDGRTGLLGFALVPIAIVVAGFALV